MSKKYKNRLIWIDGVDFSCRKSIVCLSPNKNAQHEQGI
ncbi:competence protein [Streptococcus sp. LQJ-218]|nr:competence protein [Streptococcus sp. LQJ-218]